MTKFQPFKALRYSNKVELNSVVSPPYDVLSANDRSRLANLSPFNVVHIDCPLEEDGPDRYIQAGATIRQWVDQGILLVS